MTVYGLQPIIIQTETACAAVFKTCEHCVAICCSHVTKSAFLLALQFLLMSDVSTVLSNSQRTFSLSSVQSFVCHLHSINCAVYL